jgi:GH25 family lysozyme M1 (1,4-beta-N-acetylmuramidase)
MLSRRTLLIAALAVLLLVAVTVTVEARHSRRQTIPSIPLQRTTPRPHPADVADEATLKLWEKVRMEMAARNYSRPTKQQLKELGYPIMSPDDGVYGVDISSWIGEDTWQCIIQNGYSFGVAREFQETCQVDPNGVHTVANAWASGISHMDVYLFPSYGCGTSAAGQVDATISSMGTIPFGMIWIDIEDGGQGAAQDNYNWMMAALAEIDSQLGSGRAGIYSSEYEWGQVMGGLSGPTNYPLWYADYDGNPNFNGFNGFGGWTTPNVKQFAGDSTVCGADVDLDWY